MNTLLLAPEYSGDTNLLWQAAVKAGWHTARAQRYQAPELDLLSNIAAYGNPIFVAAMAHQTGRRVLEARPDWLPSLPPEYLLREVAHLLRADLETHWKQPRFVKPATDKFFEARVYEHPRHIAGLATLEADLPMLVAEPVAFELEFRNFIHQRAVVATSLYARDGGATGSGATGWTWEAEEEAQARSFLNTVLADPRVPLPPSIVVDVGLIRGRGWAVVEANEACSSGLYGCDPDAVLPTLLETWKRVEAITDADRPWVWRTGSGART